jgi:hypothetical protein
LWYLLPDSKALNCNCAITVYGNIGAEKILDIEVALSISITIYLLRQTLNEMHIA